MRHHSRGSGKPNHRAWLLVAVVPATETNGKWLEEVAVKILKLDHHASAEPKTSTLSVTSCWESARHISVRSQVSICNGPLPGVSPQHHLCQRDHTAAVVAQRRRRYTHISVCIVRRQPRETVGVKRHFPHRLGDGSNLGPCPHIRGPFGVRFWG